MLSLLPYIHSLDPVQSRRCLNFMLRNLAVPGTPQKACLTWSDLLQGLQCELAPLPCLSVSWRPRADSVV